jgi:hypothetical protein
MINLNLLKSKSFKNIEKYLLDKFLVEQRKIYVLAINAAIFAKINSQKSGKNP